MKYHCPNCGADVAPARVHLGYKQCLECGEARAKEVRMGWCVAPAYNKGAYQLITDPADMRGTNPKRTEQ
jgi:hypothetical protein